MVKVKGDTGIDIRNQPNAGQKLQEGKVCFGSQFQRGTVYHDKEEMAEHLCAWQQGGVEKAVPMAVDQEAGQGAGGRGPAAAFRGLPLVTCFH